MGTKCALTYAKHLYWYISRNTYLSFNQRKKEIIPHICWQDIFIWAGSDNDPQQFISKINEMHLCKVWFQMKFQYLIGEKKTGLNFSRVKLLVEYYLKIGHFSLTKF